MHVDIVCECVRNFRKYQFNNRELKQATFLSKRTIGDKTSQMTRENSGVARAKFRNIASYKIKWRQDYIELKYLRKKPRIFWSPMHGRQPEVNRTVTDGE